MTVVMDKFGNRLPSRSNAPLPSQPNIALQMLAMSVRQFGECVIAKKLCSFHGTGSCTSCKRTVVSVVRGEQMKIDLVLFNSKQSLPFSSCKVKPKPMRGYFILLQCGVCCQITCTWMNSDFIQRPLKLIAGFPLVLVCLRQKTL